MMLPRRHLPNSRRRKSDSNSALSRSAPGQGPSVSISPPLAPRVFVQITTCTLPSVSARCPRASLLLVCPSRPAARSSSLSDARARCHDRWRSKSTMTIFIRRSLLQNLSIQRKKGGTRRATFSPRSRNDPEEYFRRAVTRTNYKETEEINGKRTETECNTIDRTTPFLLPF